MSSEACSWCKQQILTSSDSENVGNSGLCLTCLMSFLSGEQPDRRRAQRRQFDITPREERRILPDRRKD